jgi:hypothetical protein
MCADLQVQRLQCAAVALQSLVCGLAKLSSYQAPSLTVRQADAGTFAAALSRLKQCVATSLWLLATYAQT